MNRSAFALGLLGLLGSAASFAGERIFRVNPNALDGWTVIGAEALSREETVTLPPGSQLARAFPRGNLAVQFVTQPRFAAGSADWSVLEIGDTALIFQRDGGEARLALAVGETPPVSLPFAIPLDAAGRSAAPLALEFARCGATIAISLGGETVSFPAATPEGGVEVVASAGSSQPWVIEHLTVVLTTPDLVAMPAGKTAEENGSDAPRASAAEATADRSEGAGAANVATNAAAAAAAGAGAATAASRAALEIFTPPAVRHGRADALRAAPVSQPASR